MASKVISRAAKIAEASEQALQAEHVMKYLLELEKGDAVKILVKAGFNIDSMSYFTNKFIRQQPKIEGDTYAYSDQSKLIPLLESAREIQNELGDSCLLVEHLLLAFPSEKRFGQQLFVNHILTEKVLKDAILAVRGGERVTFITTTFFLPVQTAMAMLFDCLWRSSRSNKQVTGDKYETLDIYGRDLINLARRGKLNPVIGRDDEIRRCIQLLSRMRKNNPVIIGEPGVGKTAIVEGLAQWIVRGDVPEPLLNWKLIALDLLSFVAGAKYRGEFEESLKAVSKEASATNGQIVLFIDDIHNVAGSGAGNMLKSMLDQGGFRFIGATTLQGYELYLEKDPELKRRFVQVFVQQPSVEGTISILRGLRERYELLHGVKISDSALVAAATLSDRYIPDHVQPDKAIDLVDEAAARLEMEITFKPIEQDNIDRAVLQLEMERISLINDTSNASNELLTELDHDLGALKHKQKELHKRLISEEGMINRIRSLKKEIKQNKNRTAKLVMPLERQLEEAEKSLRDYRRSGNSLLRDKVTDLEVAEAVSRRTGIPLSNLHQRTMERDNLPVLEQLLRQRVAGQDAAVRSVVDAICRSRVGLSDPNRPIASFMFVGPTGVGKTELAKALAECLESNLVLIPMGGYAEDLLVPQLVGVPSGLNGYEEGGFLTELVRWRPYSVVLLERIEDAPDGAVNIVSKLLRDGRITDARGRTVSFTNTVVIMTSNIGSDYILGNSQDDDDAMKRQVVELATETFGPEFMDRVDDCIVFQALDSQQISDIVEIQLNLVKDRLKQEKNINFSYTKEAVTLLAAMDYNLKLGAMSVKRVVEHKVGDEICKEIMRGDYNKEDTMLLDQKKTIATSTNRLCIKKLKI